MSRAWSLGKTDRWQMDAVQKKDNFLANVAPGSYEKHLGDKKKEPQWSMGANLVTVDKRVIVSPQQYNIPSKIIENQGKSIGAKLKGSMETTSIAPGPGAYVQEKVRYDNLSYSMGTKLEHHKVLNVPGPGTYKSSLVDKAAVQCGKFGSSQRGKVELENARVVPGPGEHSPEFRNLKKQSPRFGFGSEKRASPINEKLAQFPGPGNYSLGGVVGSEGKKVTMHSTIKYDPLNKEHSYKPGAGTYDPNIFNSKKKEPQYKLGTSTRINNIEREQRKFQQAPGAYNPAFSQTWTSSSKWGFGSDTRKGVTARDSAALPGPGAFSIPSKFQENSKYSMAARLDNDLSPMKNIPGPGQYDLQNKDNGNFKNSKKFSVGTSQRGSMVNKSLNVPGPGNYKESLYNKSTSPKFGFGSGGRAQMNKTSAQFPGPGAYPNRSLVGTEGNKNTMHSKLEYRPIENIGGKTPGPGAYESHTNNKNKAPAYGAGSQKRDFGVAKYILAQPASNTYNPNQTFTQKGAAKWGFGSEKRASPIDEKLGHLPGPGNYNISPLAFDSKNPKFFVGQKIAPAKDVTNTPGVGSYDPSPEKTKKTLPSYSMKQKLGSSLVDTSNKNPAPGAYEASLNDKKAAPKFGFGSSTRNTKQNMNVPGPGAYRIPSSIGDVPNYAMPNRSDESKYI